jgi:hypothetical protein
MASCRSAVSKPSVNPAVESCQQLVGGFPLTLALPQPAQAHGRPQLQRLGLLAASHPEGLVKAGLRPGF